MFLAQKFGEQVKQFRGEDGMRHAAWEIGISPSTLSRIERGYAPDVNTFLALMYWMNEDVEQYTDPTVAGNITRRKLT